MVGYSASVSVTVGLGGASAEASLKTAKNLEEARELVKAGFEFFTKIDGVQVFRKRKRR
ncbi:MAG: hypothetical protein OEZ21_08340 [Candidatus Bathyarchaeota archaeon]|nr:hypothetical protein [Candidatus Bathyarchaeota archaeon]MDH5746945.1 hypothetical protein [Candidatus Bathyarchaeota archaeon]